MKKGKRIRFHIVNYTGHRLRVSPTGQVAEGEILKSDGTDYVVRVEGYTLPFFVSPDDIIDDIPQEG